jgi:hypothetical protein
MIIGLGGNGIELTRNSNEISIVWNGDEISSIPVIQPEINYCDISEIPIEKQKLTYLPPQTGEDAEFDGNGPRIDCAVEIYIDGNRVNASIYMRAKEIDGGTEAKGTEIFTLYQNTDPNKKIYKILSDKKSTKSYTDDDKSDDTFHMGDSDLVESFKFTGDTYGDDAGTDTQVIVRLNPIKIQIKEIRNCVEPDVIEILTKDNFIDPETVRRLRTSLSRQ